MNLDDLDGRIGEGWGGASPNGSHVNVVLARRGSPTAAAALSMFAHPSPGHTPVLCCVGPSQQEYEPVWPPTLMMNKATATDEHHETITWGAAQLGIGQGVLDAVADGLIEATGDLIVLVAVWVAAQTRTTTAVREAAASPCARLLECASEGRDPQAAARLVATATRSQPVLRRQLMRISAVETRRYRVELDPPFRAAWDPVARDHQVATLVGVHTDEGLSGWASGDALPDREQLESFLVGLDPFRTEIVRELGETVDFHGSRAWIAEAAVWDVIGKVTGQPVWKLLGGRSERLLAYASSGGTGRAGRASPALCRASRRGREGRQDPLPPRRLARRRRGRRGGARRGRRRPRDHGRRQPGLAHARRPRAALGRRDRRAGRRALEPLGVYWLEEPLRTDDLEGYAALRRLTSLRLAAGEMVRSAQEARDLVLRGGIDVLAVRCRALARDRWVPPRCCARRPLGACLVAAHVVERLWAARQPARRARVLDSALRRGAVRPAGVAGGAPRLAAAGADRDLPRRHDCAPGRAGARDRAGPRRARALAGRLMRMRAAVLREPGRPLVVEDVELDPPKAGEVLVKVAAAGVCHSDVHLADGALGPGRWPMVLGHEGAGVVEAVGEGVTHVAPGDPVGFCFVPSCRTCPACRAGRFNMCGPAGENGVRGTLMDGTSRLRLPDGTALQHGLMTACFAEYTVVDARGAVPLPVELPLWQGALLGCGVMTGFGAVRNVGRVGRGRALP